MTKEKKSTFHSPKEETMEQLCKRLGIPYSEITHPKGTASISFMHKLKHKDKNKKEE